MLKSANIIICITMFLGTKIFFILLIYKRSHREVYQEFQPSYNIVRRSSAKGCLDHRFRAPPADC